jgi:hypothetical protein
MVRRRSTVRFRKGAPVQRNRFEQIRTTGGANSGANRFGFWDSARSAQAHRWEPVSAGVWDVQWSAEPGSFHNQDRAGGWGHPAASVLFPADRPVKVIVARLMAAPCGQRTGEADWIDPGSGRLAQVG